MCDRECHRIRRAAARIDESDIRDARDLGGSSLRPETTTAARASAPQDSRDLIGTRRRTPRLRLLDLVRMPDRQPAATAQDSSSDSRLGTPTPEHRPSRNIHGRFATVRPAARMANSRRAAARRAPWLGQASSRDQLSIGFGGIISWEKCDFIDDGTDERVPSDAPEACRVNFDRDGVRQLDRVRRLFRDEQLKG